MKKEYLEDFIEIHNSILKQEEILIPIGDIVQHYTIMCVYNSETGCEPTTNDCYKAYLQTMKKYIVDKDYEKKQND